MPSALCYARDSSSARVISASESSEFGSHDEGCTRMHQIINLVTILVTPLSGTNSTAPTF